MSSTSTDWIALVHFWSGDRYELMEREADPEDPQQCTPLETGELVVLRSVPAERRRHRLVVRALQESVGRRVTLEFKNRRAVSGVLADFDAESGVGRLDELVFVAGQVWAVQAGTA
jgi:hypothetical protein